MTKVVKSLFLGLALALCAMFAFQTTEVSYAAEDTGVLLASSDTNSSGNSGSSEEFNADVNDIHVQMTGNGDDASLHVQGIGGGNAASTWSTLFNKFKVIIIGITGIATLVFVLFFVKNFMVLGANSGNPSARREAINGCLWTGIAAAGCGAVTILVGLSWNAFK